MPMLLFMRMQDNIVFLLLSCSPHIPFLSPILTMVIPNAVVLQLVAMVLAAGMIKPTSGEMEINGYSESRRTR